MSDTTDAAEQLALMLTQSGLQRMTARVLAAFLFAEQETVTAGEIAERLGISPGSVSTAIKSLISVGLIERVPAPGSRREHFRVPDEGWATLMSTQNAAVQMMQDAADKGIQAAGEDSIAGRRLATMRDFYAHIMRELPAVIDRWRATRNPEK
jgi:DNA-binding transcriptional regulator GbsR (MarR family)